MGLSCSCGGPGCRASWTDLKSRLQQSAQQRKDNRCCCTDRRPKWLKIRRRTVKKVKKVKFEGCTCTPHICCQAMQPDAPHVSPMPQKVCRFTVDAYFT